MPVWIFYQNHRRELGWRHIRIHEGSFRFGTTEFHPTACWLFDAYDLQKQAERTFVLKDVLQWKEEDVTNQGVTRNESA